MSDARFQPGCSRKAKKESFGVTRTCRRGAGSVCRGRRAWLLAGRPHVDEARLGIAGGATQNSIRVAQWMTQAPGCTAFVGCIGTDAFGTQLEMAARADGVNVQYMKQSKEPTGTCAVLVKGGERSLIANLAAANCYDKSHFDSPAIQDLLNATKIVYSAGFPITTPAGPPTLMALGKACNEGGKTFCMKASMLRITLGES